MSVIEIVKKFHGVPDDFEINVKLDLKEGETIALYGESGAGKTSILRMIAGLMKPDSGKISFAGALWYDGVRNYHMPIQKRELGMVFQGSSLFPNMSVIQNLEFAAQGKWENGPIEEIATRFQIQDLLNRNTNNLSGGQKQRVELARTILRKPRILLLDEPFNALDHNLKADLRKVLIDHIQELKITTILVSHDVVDVITMADHVYQIDQGKIIREGKPLNTFSTETSISNFHITGDVIGIEHGQILSIVSILIGKQIVKVAAHPSEIIEVSTGDRISINSKAFNPILTKIK